MDDVCGTLDMPYLPDALANDQIGHAVILGGHTDLVFGSSLLEMFSELRLMAVPSVDKAVAQPCRYR